MVLPADEIIGKYAKRFKHCFRKTFLPYEHECNCMSHGYNVVKRNNEIKKKVKGKKNKTLSNGQITLERKSYVFVFISIEGIYW